VRTTSTDKPKKSTNLFVSGVLILSISNVLQKVIGATLKIPLHGLLGGDGMGYYYIAYAIYVWFYMISTAGLPVAISIMISDSRARGNFREANKIFGITLRFFMAIGMAGTVIMIFGSKLFAKLYEQQGAYLAIMALAPTLFFVCISSCLRGYFQGYQLMLPTAISQLIEALGKLIIGISLAILTIRQGYGTEVTAAATVMGLTVGVFVGMLFLIFYKFRFKSEAYDAEFARPDSDTMPVRGWRSIAKQLFMIAVPVTLSASVMSFTSVIDGIIISRQLQSIGYTADLARTMMGDYSAQAVTMWNVPPALIYPIAYSIIPLISAAMKMGQTERVKTIMNSAIKVAALIALPSSIGMSVLSEPILKLVFTDQAAAERVAPLLSVLALSIFFISMLSITNAILQVYGHERKPIISMLAGSAVKIAVSYILIGTPSIGIFGAPVSTFVCYFVIMLINFYFVARYVGLIPDVKVILIKPLISAIICGAAAIGSHRLLVLVLNTKIATVCAIGIAALVYGVFIFIIGAVTRDDIMLLPKGSKLCAIFEKLRLLKKVDAGS
jgi:stage V sporulation protein B